MSQSTRSNDAYNTDVLYATLDGIGYESPDNPPAFPQPAYAPGVQGNMSSAYSTTPAAPYGYPFQTTGLSNGPHQMNYPSDGPCGLAQVIPRGKANKPSASAADPRMCNCCVIA